MADTRSPVPGYGNQFCRPPDSIGGLASAARPAASQQHGLWTDRLRLHVRHDGGRIPGRMGYGSLRRSARVFVHSDLVVHRGGIARVRALGTPVFGGPILDGHRRVRKFFGRNESRLRMVSGSRARFRGGRLQRRVDDRIPGRTAGDRVYHAEVRLALGLSRTELAGLRVGDSVALRLLSFREASWREPAGTRVYSRGHVQNRSASPQPDAASAPADVGADCVPVPGGAGGAILLVLDACVPAPIARLQLG